MKKIFALFIFALMITFSSSNVNAQKIFWEVPQFYLVKDRVPYESSLRMTFIANTTVELYDNPKVDGANVIGTIQAGETVQRISCLVYAHPALHPVKILRTFDALSSADGVETLTLQAGEYVYLVMYTGEGSVLGLYQGKEVWWLDIMNIKNLLREVDMPTAWGEYEGNPTDKNLSIDTWDCYRKSDGTTGWALVQKNGKFLGNLNIMDKPF